MTLYLNYWTLISFSLLITASPHWPVMPSWHFLLLALTVILTSVKYRKVRYFLGLVLACVVILVHGNLLRYKTEMLFQAGQDITITADVDSLFKPINYGFQGIVIVRSINGQALTSLARPRVRLKGPVRLKARDVISASVKVNAIYGLMNQVGFDAENYALVNSLVASLSVNKKHSYYTITRQSLRSTLINKVSERLTDSEHKGIILALMFGQRDDIPAQLWQQLKQSGLSHLIAISGLHIALVFTFGWTAGLIAMRLHYSMRFAPVVAGIIFAWSYTWLAGFAIPTQRAWVMCCIVCVMQYRAGFLPFAYRWLLVLALILLIEPFSTLSSSLWMSMYAVAIIMLSRSLILGEQGWLIGLVKMQVVLVIAMAPLVAFLFQGVSVGAVVYNLMFVPWFSFVVMPLAFIALLLLLLGDTTHWIWYAVNWSLEPINWMTSKSHWCWLELSNDQLKWLMLLVMLIPILTLIRREARVCILVVVGLATVDWSNKPIWKLTTLDVGHGLAVVVQQGNSAMVYDTGAAWKNSSFAQQIVSPYLTLSGVDDVNYLVLSHFDNDHAGGWREIYNKWQPKNLLSSQQLIGAQACLVGKKWQWDQIEIEAIWPPSVVKRAYNPHSCVIRLKHRTQGSSVLLSGDIDSVSEWLLLRQSSDINTDIVVVPHHGSNTSSIMPFVTMLSPDVAIASVAKGGRWSLPSQKVIQRYESAGARWLATGDDGQITVEFYPNYTQVDALRQWKGMTWYRQMLRKGVE